MVCWTLEVHVLTNTLIESFSVPIHAFWDVQDRPHARCVNVDLLFLIPGGINCALDAIIVFMVGHETPLRSTNLLT